MKLSSDLLKIDAEATKRKIASFIKDYVEKSGVEGVVLGVSGGVDSCTAAALASLALRGERVLGLFLPEKETYKTTDEEHVRLIHKKFGFQLKTLDITSILDSYYAALPVSNNKLAKGNLKARTRMVIIYYYANKLNRIVCGSSDKSETMMGYFTKWGDVAADISPLMDLYKSQVCQLAQHIGLPNEIVTKPPSPNLWPNHFAEEELGIKYEILDLILYGLEHFMETDYIAKQLGVSIELVEGVKRRWLGNEHKRRMPLTVKLSYRTVGADFRLPHLLG
ncbi:MAG: NAD+ synthase [Candidatus Bathyarchaeia archaeon]